SAGFPLLEHPDFVCFFSASDRTLRSNTIALSLDTFANSAAQKPAFQTKRGYARSCCMSADDLWCIRYEILLPTFRFLTLRRNSRCATSKLHEYLGPRIPASEDDLRPVHVCALYNGAHLRGCRHVTRLLGGEVSVQGIRCRPRACPGLREHPDRVGVDC